MVKIKNLVSIGDSNQVVLTLIKGLKSNHQIITIESGEEASHRALQSFINNRLQNYAEDRNDPTKPGLSDLSPYLHFGQISSLRVALEVKKATHQDIKLKAGTDVFLEELIIRKELSDNFCFYNQNYKKLSGAPDWALKTLRLHADDTRDFTYTYAQLEAAQTHDEAWNAAQRQLVTDGKIHGYMRMYWAKKILQWTDTPQTAQRFLVRLNDFYHLDGGDPNGYVGILWSVAGLHDRPWFERSIFGTVRYMNFNGLQRKFDVKKYIKQNSEEH